MEKPKMKVIECDGFVIAGMIDSYTKEEFPVYYPANYLIYVERGQLNLRIGDKIYSIKENEFGLIRKFTHGTFYKTWNENQNGFRDHIFVLHDAFIKEVIRNFELPTDFMPCTAPMIKFFDSPILKGLMNSIEAYVTGQAQIDRPLIRIKTLEALYALVKLKPELIHIFNEFSEPTKADLVNFVEHNYTKNLSLQQFAELSGRSLSTFTREFKREFKVTPYKWLKQKRLELARKLLLQTKKTASEIYLEVGFEDLAHFSRSFKEYFGLNPSELKVVHSV